MKKMLALFLTLTVIFSLAACAGKEPPATDTDSQVSDTTASVESSEEHTEEVTLTFWALSKWAGVNGTEENGQYGDWERYMAEEFSKQHPNVTIEVEVYDTQSGPAVMASAIAAGETPDVVHDANVRLMQYSNSDYLVPVKDYMSEETRNTFADGTFESVQIADGNAYFVPYGTNVLSMMVNKTLFDQAGCADLLPQGEDRSWTYDEYYTAVTTAMERLDGVYGVPLFADVSSGGDMYTWCWIYAAGGTMFDAATNRMGCNTAETKTGLEFWKKMIDNGVSAPGGAALNAGGGPQLFYQQQVLTVPCATVHYTRLVNGQANDTYANFDVEVYAMPHAEGVDTISCADPHGFAVWRNDDAEKLYWSEMFVNYLAGDENAKYVKAAGEVSYKKCAQDLYEGEDDNLVFMGTLMPYLVPSGSTVPGYTTARFEVTPYYQQLYLGEISVEDFCETVEEVCNQYLENYEP